MFTLSELTLPIIAAPMAGGASTPALVAAVNEAGGLGFLAAGYKSATAMSEQVARARELTGRPFGVNLFVPAVTDPAALAAVSAYRAELRPEAEQWGVSLPERIAPDDDGWDAKIAALLADPVPVISYTFGLPTAQEADALRAVGTTQVATVTSTAEARAAAALGLDALCVQGPEAGGHRGTHQAAAEPGSESLLDLLPLVRAAVDLPLIAAGGLGDGPGIATALRAGADAVQLGTAYLLAEEAGTSAPHRAALADPPFAETVRTRAFTGRVARGLRNAFTDRHADHAPPAYPEVHHLTAPLRAAAAGRGDAQHLHLWAGTAFAKARPGAAAEITERLWREAQE
ncbi:NAD(P)H-dependent flavin oxidoreductase [Kitasatospora kifunensis]|uniref:Probable nitronate monooxygenase n=1 Tax=Kitasatospora kifunensis TaxID=58351 RepID=A0A7W7QYU6_KITKI|nr:nitronate monooxygenase [Kitasatospora kifunensis]MBB4922341.1 nitronate monooxygenase [Kitasatospora kifunensis]